MAPARTPGTATRRVDQDHHHQEQQQDNGDDEDFDELFVDPMHGTPLGIYIEKEVEDKENLAALVKKHGGIVSPGYSGVPYILVDPHKVSGQNLWRQYSNKKGKIILNAEWVKKCVEARELLTYASDWGGCKVTGKEDVADTVPNAPLRLQQQLQQQQMEQQQQLPEFLPHPSNLMGPSMPPPLTIHHIIATSPPPPIHIITPITVHSIMQQHAAAQQAQAHAQAQAQAEVTPPAPAPAAPSNAPFPFPVFAATSHPALRALDPDEPEPPQTWQESGSIAPSQTHLHPSPQPPGPAEIQEQAQAQAQTEASTSTEDHPTSMPPHLFHHRPPEATWNGFDPAAPQDPMAFEYRETAWDPYYAAYYGPSYLEDPSTQIDPTQHTSGPGVPPVAHLPPAPPPPAPFVGPAAPGPVTRGRKKARNATKSTTPTAHLVPNKGPPARSPSPPARVIKSTYGGNLFTAEDVLYLKRYIDYCQEQGLVLSLREICERIAIKAPHHTFYSWRRYCNKHKIRLGGYLMTADREGSPMDDDGEEVIEEDPDAVSSILAGNTELPAGGGSGLPSVPLGMILQQINPSLHRDRSPTPPRALFRSTTGKGVAFTAEDITFLLRFMEYRRSQGKLDMIQFWKEVAAKAPHHSRASWMKYWRRHKHEFEEAAQEPLPVPPEKKMRYSRSDDVLLAKYFYSKPEGTMEKVFQSFGKMYPHHPWKGWQEHHRLHKPKIDHLIERLGLGEDIDEEGPHG